MKRHLIPLPLLLTLMLILQTETWSQSADIILTNGKIFTADTDQPYTEALAIKGDKIMAVGTNSKVNQLASSKTKRIDLHVKTVVPGFNNVYFFYACSAAPCHQQCTYHYRWKDGLSKDRPDGRQKIIYAQQPRLGSTQIIHYHCF